MALFKKRGDMKVLVYGILFSVISLIVILWILMASANNAGIQSSLGICRSSIILSEKTELNIEGVAKKPFPVLCKTHDLKIPEKEDYRIYEEDTEGVMNNMAERIADCW